MLHRDRFTHRQRTIDRVQIRGARFFRSDMRNGKKVRVPPRLEGVVYTKTLVSLTSYTRALLKEVV